MRLRVIHETRYSYSSPVHAMAMEARLQPCTDDYQTCLRYRLAITPKVPVQEYTTYSDLTVHYWTLLKATEVIVLSEGMVETHERPLTPIEVPPMEINQVDYFPYLQPTTLTAITPAIREFAGQFSKLARENWYETAVAVREAIHAAVDFQVGFTHVQTTATEVLRGRRGVCQDFTHLMVATLRALGIPARYTSGYLSQDISREPALNAGGLAYQSMSQSMSSNYMEQSMGDFSQSLFGERSVHGSGASHAWCEVYMGPEHGWRGFDAANNLLVDQLYVRIGCGRDFNDLTPIKGVHKGPAEEKLEVHVDVKSAA